ncbi:nitrogenase-stabilizing/protective protein NifW [Frankia sp. R82]|uniref:nitrogenase-stabilizing/protective protein NifW n=1 Tax=Frankia sp. R82 TaxID=2950553 RepID=UPI0020443971|nr:nitrogenase-stabilizing/protective protein NifW [Frankia sp. R82]MCM3883568.1 nitrogenase-stabilizing/protective protein NifW [Frankia sp. R82]
MTATATPAERLADFHRCTTAEQYLDLLEVDYDPRVVAVNRLHILRVFGGERVKALEAAGGDQADPGTVLAAYRAALIRSYESFLTATALDHRVFKVLKDRAPEGSFVPSSEITVQRPGDAPAAAPSAPNEQPEEAR